MLSPLLSVINKDGNIDNRQHLLVHGIMGNSPFYITGCWSWAQTGRAGGARIYAKPIPCIHTFNPHNSWVTWAYCYPCFQMGKLGFRELRGLAHLSVAVSPPWPECGGHVTKSGSLEWLQDFSADPWRECCPSVPVVARGWLWSPFPDTEAASLGRERVRPHTESSREKNHPLLSACGPLNPAVLLPDTLQFCELINPLLCNVVWVEFLPPKKSRLIKHLIELKMWASDKFLTCLAGNFVCQKIEEATREIATLDLILTNMDTLAGEVDVTCN